MTVFRTNPSAKYFEGKQGDSPTSAIAPGENFGAGDERWAVRVWGDNTQALHVPMSDLLQRRGAIRTIRSGLDPYTTALHSPIVLYETYVWTEVSAARKSNRNVDLAELHAQGLKHASSMLPKYHANMKEGALRELEALRSGTHQEENMSQIFGPRNAKITGDDPSQYGFTVPAEVSKNAPTGNQNVRVARYKSEDGQTYLFNVGRKTTTGFQINYNNIFMHVCSELVKGGSPLEVLAAAGVKVVSTDGVEVINFTEVLKKRSAPEEEDEPEAEVELV